MYNYHCLQILLHYIICLYTILYIIVTLYYMQKIQRCYQKKKTYQNKFSKVEGRKIKKTVVVPYTNNNLKEKLRKPSHLQLYRKE